jgi:hypothetical protein
MTDRPQPNKSSHAPQASPPDDYMLSAQGGRRSGSQRMGLGETVIKAFIRSIASSIGRIIVRTLTKRMR